MITSGRQIISRHLGILLLIALIAPTLAALIATEPIQAQERVAVQELTGLLDKTVPYSIFYMDSFDLRYNRHYRALNDILWCRAKGDKVITIYGFSAKGITVFDVTNPIDPVRVTGTSIGMGGGGYRVSFKPASADSSYIAFTNKGLGKPSAV